MPSLMTVPEAASRLNLRHETVRRMIYRGELEAIHVGAKTAKRRTLRIRSEAIDSFLACRATDGAKPLPPGFKAKLEQARAAR